METLDKNNIPRHIAIIMDGNGRWAKKRGLPKLEGHRAGSRAVEEAVKGCLELGVKVLSLYTFSTENWQRPKPEVQALMTLLEQYLKKYLAELKKNKVGLFISGESSGLPEGLRLQIQAAVSETKPDCRLLLNLALNYGGRQDILQATRAIVAELKDQPLQIGQIDQKFFSEHLYTKGLPDPDLLIRTSGEKRLSNFFLWQISYSELYFTPKLWPDFKKEDLFAAVLEYQRRERRFGA